LRVRRAVFSATLNFMGMTPYIKASSPLHGEQKPGIKHGAGLPRVQRRQKEEVAATRRALKKAARREGNREIEEAE
jgi:hypothetical protein